MDPIEGVGAALRAAGHGAVSGAVLDGVVPSLAVVAASEAYGFVVPRFEQHVYINLSLSLSPTTRIGVSIP